TRESSKSAGAASPKSSATAARASAADEIASPKLTEGKPRTDLPAPPAAPARREALARSGAPEEKIYPQNYAPAAPPVLNAGPAALQSAAASGDTALTTVLLDQG